MIRFPFETENKEPMLWELLDATVELRRKEFEERLAAMPVKEPEPLSVQVDRFQSIDDPPLELDKYSPKLTIELTPSLRPVDAMLRVGPCGSPPPTPRRASEAILGDFQPRGTT